ncbi:3'(2'),5'-bisphosphate nucleotidase CysQ [Porphyridium purpureum]|uniref:3'(2'),5'-bisphosphate nucleotidase 1 n=1 Tax=Porphyridium purpureum TaxID=35688 RepID=A0A5J4YXU3_PORPP|nr:3'(2'),5'-bisphosphate nucleotidase CysQ [Porphyridium purpureum]|eukprot:POR4576..scf209_3
MRGSDGTSYIYISCSWHSYCIARLWAGTICGRMIFQAGDVEVDVLELVRIAEDAGKVILEIYSKDVDSWEQKIKADDSPLTVADLKANDLICTRLKELTPEFPIMSEELEQLPYEQRKSWSYYWCVDPLDGTKEFIKRNGDFTVNIALMHENHGVVGVVHTPVRDQTHYAASKLGAFVRKQADQPRPIKVESYAMSDPNLTLVCSASHLDPRTEEYMAQFTEPKTVSMGSSLKFLLVAEGAAHVYPRFAPTMEWDTAASQVIVEEAGGEVVVVETEKPLTYNRENLLNPYFICRGQCIA